MTPALAAKCRCVLGHSQTERWYRQRASMERIRRELRNVKVQQLADRAYMAIGVPV
jgi:hypothetical protein